MKDFRSFLLAVLLVSATYAQEFNKGSITLTDNSVVSGQIAIDYTNNKVLYKKGFSESIYTIDRVKQIQIQDEMYAKQPFAGQTYFSRKINAGGDKVALYQVSSHEYLVKTPEQTAQKIDLINQQARIPGILSVLFEDCNTVRDAFQFKQEYDEGDIIALVNDYQNCDNQGYAPTDWELESANSFLTDQARFYVGSGIGIRSITFFDADESESQLSGLITVGVQASPSFLGSLQGNIFATLEGNVSLATDKDFSNTDQAANLRMNAYRLEGGVIYQFNKEGSIKPYIGVGAGATSDHFKGTYDGNDFDIDGGNIFFAPKVGFLLSLPNDAHLGFELKYLSDYDNDLRFPVGDEVVPLEIDSKNITIGVNYFF